MAFPGVLVPLVTPFTDDGALDLDSMPAVVEFMLAAGVSGVVAAGTTGEGYALSTQERRDVISSVIATVAGRVPVLAGVGGMATREAVAQAVDARELGVDGLMVAAPAYVLPNPEELGRHILAVLETADLPTVLYDYPDRSGVSFTERTLDLVAHDERVVGIKEASGDLTRVRRLRRRYGNAVPIVSGTDGLAMRMFEMGVDSWIAGTANALPAEHVEILAAAVAGDMDTAWAVHKRILPFLRTAERGRYTPKVKLALELRGVRVGPPRPPLGASDDSERAEVASRLAVALGGNEPVAHVQYLARTADANPLPMHKHAFINGSFVPAVSGAMMPITNPATGEDVGEVAACDAADIDRAVAVARDVFERGEWSMAHPSHRRKVLIRFAKLIERHNEDLARLDSLEAGKPITDCRDGDVPEAADTMRWFAESIDKVYDRQAPTGVDVVARITREPVGVVGAVLPWNFPTLMFIWKVAPALAMGNSVVVKPAEQTSLSALLLAELGLDAGLPKGVLNVVPGLGETAGQALGLHPDVDMVTFTGTTEIGRRFLEYSAQSNLKRITLECGGKSPQIILESVRDLDEAAAEAVRAAFWNMGENCSAGSRILVHRSLHESFVERLVLATADLRVGDPSDPRTEIGPLIDPAACERSERFVAQGVVDGARVAIGGGRTLTQTGGWYFEPTVLDGVPVDSVVAREEIFGPVVAVIPFDSEEEAINIANASSYGLASSLWSDDIDAAHRVARRLKAGTVSINCYSEGDYTTPFGGYKQSGFGGRDKGIDALDQYCETKTTWLRVRW